MSVIFENGIYTELEVNTILAYRKYGNCSYVDSIYTLANAYLDFICQKVMYERNKKGYS